MNTATVQLEQQRNVMRSIVDGIGTVEDVVSSETLTQGGRQTIGGMLAQLRRNAMEAIDNTEIDERIRSGYKQTAIDNLAGLICQLCDMRTALRTSSLTEITDEQLQLFAMAARNFSDKAYYYLDSRQMEA